MHSVYTECMTTTADLTDRIAAQSEQGYVSLDRADVIKAIRTALKRRTGKTWSVTGGTGTGWGWLRIDAPPKRRTARWVDNGRKDDMGYTAYDLEDIGEAGGYITPEDQAILCDALGLERVHHQGVSIPSGGDYWEEYINRAEGRSVRKHGEQYWD